jgi:ribose transport system permease protein
MTKLWKKFYTSYARLAIVLFVVLFAVDLILLPNMLASRNIITILALLVTFVIASMAATPSILSGGGGIDISIGALMGFINVGTFTFIGYLGIHGSISTILALLAVGALIGAVNGILVTMVRLQPIVATLGTNLILTGMSLYLMPNPTGVAPEWLQNLAGYMGPIPIPLLVAGIPMLLWWLLTRLPYHEALMAVGGDERAAFSSGLPIRSIRIIAYSIGGLLAAVAGIALTAFMGSGDSRLGANYTLVAIAGAALGGTSLAGGRGGMLGSVFGALDIFFIVKLLSIVHISSFWFQVAYGLILLATLITNSLIRTSADKRLGM